jgi:hypothetical protein
VIYCEKIRGQQLIVESKARKRQARRSAISLRRERTAKEQINDFAAKFCAQLKSAYICLL